MALPLSGAISFEDIALELYGDKNKAISLDSTLTRLLAGKSSGSISLSDLYGQVGKMSYSVDDYVLTNGATKDVSVTLTTNGKTPITGKFSGTLNRGALLSKGGQLGCVTDESSPYSYGNSWSSSTSYALNDIVPNNLVSYLFAEHPDKTYQYKIITIISAASKIYVVGQFTVVNGVATNTKRPVIYGESGLPNNSNYVVGNFYTYNEVLAVISNDSAFISGSGSKEIAGAVNKWKLMSKIFNGSNNTYAYTFALYTATNIQYYPYSGTVYLRG